MIFKKDKKKITRPPLIAVIKAKQKYYREHETPAIAGIAIAGLSKAGKESVG